MTDKPELESCPFCGEEPAYGTTDQPDGTLRYDFVICPNCDLGFSTAQMAGPEQEPVSDPKAFWNRRAPRFTPEEREALDNAQEFMEHDRSCIRAMFDAGRPTDDGGYEQSFGGKWYRTNPVDESPKCNCGMDKAAATLRRIIEEDSNGR